MPLEPPPQCVCEASPEIGRYQDGQFQFHPEYVDALAEQGIAADSSLLIGAPVVAVARSREVDSQ
jgi:hypothetical protein